MKRISLPVQILIALILAILTGLFLGEYANVLKPVGDAFIMLLKMSILPYLMFALMHGIGSLQVIQAKRLVKYGVLFLVMIWAIVIGTLYLLTLAFPEHVGTPFLTPPGEIPELTSTQILALFIPQNIFSSLAHNIVPAVVIFSLFFGSALMLLTKKDHLLHVLDEAVGALSMITHWIVRLSPIGIFCLIASTTGTLSFPDFQKIAIYLITFGCATLFFAFWALPALLMSLTRVTYREFIEGLQSALLLGFSTGNIFVTLPYIMDGVNAIAKRHAVSAPESQTISKTLIPVAYNLPLVGNLMAMFFILFLAYFYGIDLSIADNLKLVPSSIMALSGPVTAGLNSISFLIDEMRLPIDGLDLFAETLSVTRNLQALAGSAGIAIFTLLTLFAFTRQLHIRPTRLVLNSIATLLLLAIAVTALYFVAPTPRPEQPPFLKLELSGGRISKVYRPGETLPERGPLQSGETTLDRIRRLGELRIGYNPEAIPFAYFNEKGHLVGYDIAYAQDLAAMLGVNLVAVPLEYKNLSPELDADEFDLAVGAISVTPKRLEEMAFSAPTAEMDVAFIVPDHRRKEFADLARVKRMRNLSIGVLEGGHFEELAREKFPLARIIPMAHYNRILVDRSIDIMLWTQQEGGVWTRINPQFSVVVPKPGIEREFDAYAMPHESTELLEYVNYWLALKELEGFKERQHEKWIEGRTQSKPPRWSLIRNLLHWVD